jgi:tRNA (guanine37-N1)-methyltransferase
MINIRVLTIFPNIFESFLAYGNPARAIQMGLASVQPVDLRQFGDEPRRSTDDYPYGGGIGMIMKPEPIVRGIRSIEAHDVVTHKILLTPQGRRLKQEIVEELSHESELLLICGRYEGIDERVRYFVNDEISVGDYVLSGGETAAMVLIDCIIRLVPGVLGSDSRIDGESFYNGLLEYPQYTRPRDFEDCPVPNVLLEGHHEKIRRWKRKMSLVKTMRNRPDLMKSITVDEEMEELLNEIESERLI